MTIVCYLESKPEKIHTVGKVPSLASAESAIRQDCRWEEHFPPEKIDDRHYSSRTESGILIYRIDD